MKKIIAVFIALAFCVLPYGCGNEAAVSKTGGENPVHQLQDKLKQKNQEAEEASGQNIDKPAGGEEAGQETSGTNPDREGSGEQTAQSDRITVYITKTGEKYHTGGCQYLSKSKIAISLDEAKESGYEPCSRCNPPE